MLCINRNKEKRRGKREPRRRNQERDRIGKRVQTSLAFTFRCVNQWDKEKLMLPNDVAPAGPAVYPMLALWYIPCWPHETSHADPVIYSVIALWYIQCWLYDIPCWTRDIFRNSPIVYPMLIVWYAMLNLWSIPFWECHVAHVNLCSKPCSPLTETLWLLCRLQISVFHLRKPTVH